MVYKNTQSWVNRARCIDEPYVIELLKERGFVARQGSVYDDWKHTDLYVDFGEGDVSVDVKRNASFQSASPNFTFTCVNGLGSKFPFKKDAYFAFVDDANGQVYVVRHSVIRDFVARLRHFPSKYSVKSEYILIPKSSIRRFATYVLSGDRSKLV